MEEFVSYLLDLLFVGGGLAAIFGIYKTFKEGKRAWSESKAIDAKTPVDVRKTEVETLDLVIENLQEENKILRDDRDYWKGMYTEVQEQVSALAKELDEYRVRVRELQESLDDFAKHSPAAQHEMPDLND